MNNPRPTIDKKRRTVLVPINPDSLAIDESLYSAAESQQCYTKLTAEAIAREFPGYMVDVYVVGTDARTVIDNRPLIDMGMHKGHHIFFTGGRSLAQLIEAGEVWAIPTPTGIVFKRTEKTTELERRAAYSLAEVRKFAEENGKNND